MDNPTGEEKPFRIPPVSNIVKALIGLREQARALAREESLTLLPSVFSRRYNVMARLLSDQVGFEITELDDTSIKLAEYISAISHALTAAGIADTDARLDEQVTRDQPESTAKSVDSTRKVKPRVFIGCSTEGRFYATVIQLQLEGLARVVIWNQGVFGLSHGTLETLVAETSEFDYAVLVLTPDDLLLKRDEAGRAARDNVIFELGLFMGALGRNKVFTVVQKGVELPTDLAGVTVAYFEPGDDKDRVAALGPVTTRLALEMGLI
jgi:predicted nucleotide-binding protein